MTEDDGPIPLHLFCFISNAAKKQPVDIFENFEGVAWFGLVWFGCVDAFQRKESGCP